MQGNEGSFQHFLQDRANVNEWKIMFDLSGESKCHKTEATLVSNGGNDLNFVCRSRWIIQIC